MLLGEVVYKVGQKHRLALPKKFRQVLGDRLIVTRGYEGCLVIVSEAEWQPLISEVESASFFDLNARASARFLLGGANEITLDSQGRFVVPDVLYDHAGLGEEVVFVGLGSWIEVWDKQRWGEVQQQLAKEGSVIAQRLASGKVE
jgi:MraZ protein